MIFMDEHEIRKVFSDGHFHDSTEMVEHFFCKYLGYFSISDSYHTVLISPCSRIYVEEYNWRRLENNILYTFLTLFDVDIKWSDGEPWWVEYVKRSTRGEL